MNGLQGTGNQDVTGRNGAGAVRWTARRRRRKGSAPSPGALVIDVRAAAWYPGHGIGTYTRELFAAMPPAHLGRAVAGWCDRRWFSPPSTSPFARRRPLAGERFWQLASRTPELTGSEGLWHNPHSGLGSPWSGPPLVVTVHDLIPMALPGEGRPGFARAFWSQVPKATSLAAKIIAVSGHTCGDLVRILGVCRDRIEVIPEAPGRCCRPIPRNVAREHVRRLYGTGSPFFLYVGGFSPRKNVSALMQAFSIVRDQGSTDASLVVVGAPDRTYAQVQALAHRLRCTSRVAFVGHVEAEELPYLYSGAEAFVYPSLYEGFGLPPLEAMACGCPVICSDATSLPEVCGDAALLVNARDIDAIAGAMQQVASEHGLALRLGIRGLKRAATFSWSVSAARTLTVYSQALEAGDRPEGS